MMMKKILVLDANSLLNRAFYGIRPLTTREGLYTNAVFGYLNILKKHLDALKPDYAAAAFDMHAPTFRHKFSDAYKATRKPMPEELRQQLPYLRRATEALGIAIVEKEGYEADDILGTLSRIASEEGDRAYLVTGDRDSFQLVDENTTVILAATHHDDEITPQVIAERYGLSPRQMIDVKSLMGDASDNIPGVKGIGEKTAIKLIQDRHDLDGVYADIDSLAVGASVKEKLKAGKKDAYDSRFLAEICREVPGLSDLSPFAYSGIDREALRPLLIELEFQKMLKTFDLEEAPPKETIQASAREEMQVSLFDALPEAAKETPVKEKDAALCTETDPFLMVKDGKFYLDSGDEVCLLTGEVLSYLKKARPQVTDSKAYYHAVQDAFGSIEGIEVSFDLFLAAYVLNSQDTQMTLARLQLILLKQQLPFGAESDPARALPYYPALFEAEKAALEKSEAKKLYYETELPLTRVLAKMEIAGFHVWREGLEQYGVFLNQCVREAEEKIWEEAGEEFVINSPKQLGRILYEKLQLPVVKKTKTGYATDAETLQKLRCYSPLIDLVLAYRTYSKLYSTYVVGMLSQIAPDGRIHTVFNQMLTATGRLSSAEPNLQNIPVKTELGREMRKFFTAENEDQVLADADYSQIELRLLAHMSGDKELIRYFAEGHDIHAQTAAEIFHVPLESVTPEMRKSAKAVNFGIVYGIGEYSLSQDIGVSLATAKEYIRNYFSLYPDVRRYLDETKAKAHETGYVTTLFGRRRNIPELAGPKKPLIAFGERVAMNTPIQGTAADIIKMAMVAVDRRLEREKMKSRLILQVHDELILECPKEEAEKAAALLSEEMEHIVSLSVPLRAEAKTGFSWFDAK